MTVGGLGVKWVVDCLDDWLSVLVVGWLNWLCPHAENVRSDDVADVCFRLYLCISDKSNNSFNS